MKRGERGSIGEKEGISPSGNPVNPEQVLTNRSEIEEVKKIGRAKRKKRTTTPRPMTWGEEWARSSKGWDVSRNHSPTQTGFGKSDQALQDRK